MMSHPLEGKGAPPCEGWMDRSMGEQEKGGPLEHMI